MSTLEGKTVLVTGGSRRLGRGIAMHLAGRGCNLVVHYRSSQVEAEKTASEAARTGRRSWLVRSPLDSEEECRAVIDNAFSTAGSVDFLVNNASTFPHGKIERSGRQELEGTMLVNAWSPLWLTNAFAERITSGAVVNMLDTRITGYDFSHFPYYLSKQVLQSITRNIALRYAPRIRVNAVAPGLVLPPEGKESAYLERLWRTVPLQANGSVKDIGEAVEFLLKSDFVTGQTIFVDGGQHLLSHLFGNTK